MGMEESMQKETSLTKTIWQHTETLSEEIMEFLRGIAVDYQKVKTSTYERYSGIGSLGKLSSVYDIMTEMRHCGLREQLKLPAVYYELAVRDAVSDIKGAWGMVKNKIRTLITANENLNGEDRMYIRTILKLDQMYAAVLNHEAYPMPEKTVGLEIPVEHLNNLLRRLTRKYLKKPEAGRADSFCVSPGGYSYRDGMLCLVSRIPRKRIQLPLKDEKTSDRQIRICIKENYALIAIPAKVKSIKHVDFLSTIYVYLGYWQMCTLSSGTVYGGKLGELAAAKSERLMEKNRERSQVRARYRESLLAGESKRAAEIEANNLGAQKYERQKKKEQAKIETYINAQINQMLRTEKPAKIVIPRPITICKEHLSNRGANRRITESPQGYVRKRLAEKCQAHCIELVEISSQGTGTVCSQCGAVGKRIAKNFVCENCGYESSASLNGARNLEKKYKKANLMDDSCMPGNEPRPEDSRK